MLTAAGAQTPPDTSVRIAPVPADRWTDEQRAIAAQFSAIGMPNAIATYLNHPALARAVLPDLRYVTNDSTLPPRHRALLTLRTAWLARSGYLWAHLAPIARASCTCHGSIVKSLRRTGSEQAERAAIR